MEISSRSLSVYLTLVYCCSLSDISAQTLTVITRPEAVITSSGSVVEGSVIQVYCTVEIADNISFNWTLNGRTLFNDPAHLRIRSNSDDGDITSVLTVDNFRENDNGVYLCSAKNTISGDVSNGTAVSLTAVHSTTDGTLMIVSEPSDNQVTILDGNHTGIGLGDTVDGSLLTCIAGHQGNGVMSYSLPTVAWTRNGRPVDDTDSRITATSTTMANGQLSSSLTITGFTVSNAGVYQCVFIDSESSGAELITTIPFRLDTGNTITIERVSPEIIVLCPPEKLVIEVRATGEYESLFWIKNENAFGDTNFPVMFPDEFPNFLEIFVREITTANDFGIYRVQLYLALDNIRTHNTLPGTQGVDFAVIAPENALTTSLDKSPVIVSEGYDVDITCRSVGVPAPSISWELENKTTSFEQSDTVTKFVVTLAGEIGNRDVIVDPGNIISTFHILSARYPDHDGVYKCIGTNDADARTVFTSSASVTVQVHVVPKVDIKADFTRVTIGDHIILTCSVLRGNPTNYVFSIVHVNTMDTTTGPARLLTGIQISDLGTYRCDVTNNAGTGSANITIKLVCKALSHPTNGIVEYNSILSSLVADTVATYSCDDGFLLIGESTRTCQLEATWSSTAPYCADYTLVQLKFAPTDHCIQWNEKRASQISLYMRNSIQEAILTEGNWTIPLDHIEDGFFSCHTHHDRTIFRTRVIGTQSASAVDVGTYIQKWVESGPAVRVDWYIVFIDKSCHVSISSMTEPECGQHVNFQRCVDICVARG